MGVEEVLAAEFELELAFESAKDLDLSRLTFCRNFGSLEDGCGVDGVGEELDGEWRVLLEDILLSRIDYVLTRLSSSFGSARTKKGTDVYSRPKALQSPLSPP